MDIDEIIEMLNENNDFEIQQKGIIEGKKIKNFNVFLQPRSIENCKLVWKNCAIIISSKSDSELLTYFDELFTWIQDINWPGAILIEERLKEMKDTTYLKRKLNEKIKIAASIEDYEWLEQLNKIKNYFQN